MPAPGITAQRTPLQRVWRLALFVTAFGLLSAPVELRAGTGFEHPHTLFQFLANGGADAFDHHDHAHASEAARAVDGERAFACLSRLASVPDLPLVDAPGAPPERAEGAAAKFAPATAWDEDRTAAIVPVLARLGSAACVPPESPPPRQPA